jgi:hypothetical protein
MPPRGKETEGERKYTLIVCEGTKTEPNYFKGLISSLGLDKPSRVVIDGTGFNTLGLINAVGKIASEWIDDRNPTVKFSSIWVVFDRDSFPPDKFDNAISSGRSRGYKVAYSNEAFELWYLLHFDYINTGLGRNEYAGKISKCIREGDKGSKFIYEKNLLDMHSIVLDAGGRIKLAIANAKRLHDMHEQGGDKSYHKHNPSTTVYQLVEELYLMAGKNIDSDE